MKRTLKHIFLALLYASIGVLITGIALYIKHLQNLPDLFDWHKTQLQQQYTAEMDGINNFDAYRDLEARVFSEVEQDIYLRQHDPLWRELNRFSQYSLSDPEGRKVNWNRTFELKPDKPIAKALLLHGLSDSPYSLRTMAETLYKRDVWVVGLRVPGHGTTPAGLVTAKWQDFAAATRLAVDYLNNNNTAELPFYMVGYSNGAALAVEYSLSVLDGEKSPLPDKLLLLSPAIGIEAVAKYAVWQSRLGVITGLEKLAWTSIQPEFDPYKYNSFAVNAGDQMYQLTLRISDLVNQLDKIGEGVRDFPPTLAFQSSVDATVIPSALIDNVFSRLASGNYELVWFDVNRNAEVESFLKSDPEQIISHLMGEQELSFTMSLLTNSDPETDQVTILSKHALTSTVTTEQSDLSWPSNVFAMSHVAMPFPPNDPLYGVDIDKDDEALNIGLIELRGENGLLTVPQAQLTRLRYNPFYSYMENRSLEFLGLPYNQR